MRPAGARNWRTIADEPAGQVANPPEVARGHGLGLDQRAAHAQAAGARLQERLGGREVDPAGRHHPDLRQGAAQRLEIGRAAEVGREDLDHVGPGLPGGDDLGRRQGARHDDLAVPPAEPDRRRGSAAGRRCTRPRPAARRGRSRGRGPSRRRGRSSRPSPLRTRRITSSGVGDGEGDLGRRDAPLGQRPDDLDEPLGRLGPDHGDDPAVEDAVEGRASGHRSPAFLISRRPPAESEENVAADPEGRQAGRRRVDRGGFPTRSGFRNQVK